MVFNHDIYFELFDGIYLSCLDKDTGVIIGTKSTDDILWFTKEDAIRIDNLLKCSTLRSYKMIQSLEPVKSFIDDFKAGLLTEEALKCHYKCY